MFKMKVDNILKTWRNVFGNWKYFLLAVIIATAFYSINVLIANWNSLVGFFPTLGFFGSLKFFIVLSIGFRNLILFHSFIGLIIISALLGILFSLIFYKAKFINIGKEKKTGVFASIGVFLAVFAPGCAACGIGLASVLGIGTAFLSFLPYDGLELSILAIAILSYAILKTTKEMYTCDIQFLKGGKNEWKKTKKKQ